MERTETATILDCIELLLTYDFAGKTRERETIFLLFKAIKLSYLLFVQCKYNNNNNDNNNLRYLQPNYLVTTFSIELIQRFTDFNQRQNN